MVLTLVAYALAMTFGQQAGFMEHETLLLMAVAPGRSGALSAH